MDFLSATRSGSAERTSLNVVLIANDARNGTVSRTLVGREDLKYLALREIRSFPGGEFVVSIEVEYQPIDETGANWSLYTILREGGNPDVIEYAARRTQDRLRNQYNLRIET